MPHLPVFVSTTFHARLLVFTNPPFIQWQNVFGGRPVPLFRFLLIAPYLSAPQELDAYPRQRRRISDKSTCDSCFFPFPLYQCPVQPVYTGVFLFTTFPPRSRRATPPRDVRSTFGFEACPSFAPYRSTGSSRFTMFMALRLLITAGGFAELLGCGVL